MTRRMAIAQAQNFAILEQLCSIIIAWIAVFKQHMFSNSILAILLLLCYTIKNDWEVFRMKQRYVPLEKRSKQKRKEHFAAKRGDWGGLNPVTRKSPNPKAYNRKKSGQWCDYEPLSGFFMS